MKIRVLLIALACLLPPALAAAAPDPTPARRVAVMVSYEGAAFEETLAGLRESLRRSGPAVEVEIFPLRGEAAEGARVVELIRKGRFSLVVALGSLALGEATAGLPELPVVAGMVLRSEEWKGHPNAAGVTLDIPIETQLRWLRKILPEARTVGVLFNPAENQGRVDQAEETARRLGLRIETRPVREPQEIPAALESLANNADVIWGISDGVVLTSETAKSILLFSFRHRIPFAGLSAAWVKAGALYALDRDYRDIGGQCGELAWKMLQGERGKALPPVAPRKIRYALNRRTAEQMKLSLPPELVRQADQLF